MHLRTAVAATLLLALAACGDPPPRSPDAPPPAAATAATAATAPAKPAAPRSRTGEVLWKLDLSDPAKRPGKLPAGAAWADEGPGGKPCFRITVPPDGAKGMFVVTIPVDLTPWRGMVVSLGCQAKADGVSEPPVAWNGIKCMLHCKSASAGDLWVNEGKVFGTFDWRTLTASASIPEDATDGAIMLGMQECTGTARIAEVTLTALAVRPLRPAPAANPPPAFKGHDLPRLRGVMSPNKFDEKDFADLAAMNVNAVRWQIGRNWGKTGGERDLAEYDKWLDGRLDELALALEAGRKHGIKLMIDIHAPPGGRLSDGTMAMVLEQPYQDHFVKIWERIARRFKGHPAVWAYDLVNEPVQNKPSPAGLGDWLGVQVKAAKAIRAIDPVTAISIEVDAWDNPQRFAWLEPVDIPNVIYQAHMYWPGEYTHQGVHNTWGEQASGGKLEYPGTFNKRPLDREALRRYLQPVRDFQLAYNAHIVIGEFSAVRWAEGADRYLADCTAIFEEYGWDWTYHAFREWGGWSFEAADLPYDRKNHPKATSPTRRAQALMAWFTQNVRKPQP
ncbi:MAG: glycoside hydrolase family 5 protein [Planctomycetes bacterium]|nr:glycoside hydrolase family 5 protein [Planctomycetota bacterium]